jgi:hypothetical protein
MEDTSVVTRATPRGLFGSIGLMAIHSKSARSLRLWFAPWFRRLNHWHPLERNDILVIPVGAYGRKPKSTCRAASLNPSK